MRPSLATDRISLGFWLNILFVVGYRGAVRSIVAIAIGFINLQRPIFPWNHSNASAPTVFTIPTTFGIAHARCYTRAERATQSATRVGSSLLDSLTVPSIHFAPKIVFAFSPICRGCTNSIAIYLIIMQDFIFLCIGPHQQSAISSGCCWWQAVEPASWLRNDLSIPSAPENMSHKHIITIYFPIWTKYNPIIAIFRACRGISIKILIYGSQRRHRHLISAWMHARHTLKCDINKFNRLQNRYTTFQ